MSHVGNFVIARYFSSLPPPFHAFPRLYTELFSFPLPPKTSLPHESRTCLLVIFAHMHAQYKIPASIYAFTFVRVRHAFFRVPFLSVPFFPLLLFPLSLLIDSPRALSTILFSRYLELRHCSFSVYGSSAHIIHQWFVGRKIPIPIYVTRHRYIYTNAVSILKNYVRSI